MISPEVTEIETLLADETSWLSLFLTCYRVYEAGLINPTQDTLLRNSGSDIELQQLDTQSFPDTQRLRVWLNAMTELASRQRLLMRED